MPRETGREFTSGPRRRLIQHVQRRREEAAFATQKILYRGTNPSRAEEKAVQAKLTTKIDFDKAQSLVPEWMQATGVSESVQELSSMALNSSLIALAPQDMQDKFADSLFTKDGKTKPSLANRVALSLGDRRETSAAVITIANTGLFTTNVTLGLLAAATGLEIESVRKEVPVKPTFASQIAERYDAPPETATEYIERVKTLLPDPDAETSQGESTLFQLLIDDKKFQGVRTNCPAVPLTRILLDEMGKQLATNPHYQDRFRGMITK